jgi:hypothetical protein
MRVSHIHLVNHPIIVISKHDTVEFVNICITASCTSMSVRPLWADWEHGVRHITMDVYPMANELGTL